MIDLKKEPVVKKEQSKSGHIYSFSDMIDVQICDVVDCDINESLPSDTQVPTYEPKFISKIDDDLNDEMNKAMRSQIMTIVNNNLTHYHQTYQSCQQKLNHKRFEILETKRRCSGNTSEIR